MMLGGPAFNPVAPWLNNAVSPQRDVGGRRSWVGGVSFVSHGVRIGVRIDDLEVFPLLAGHLPPGYRVLSSPRVDHLFSVRMGAARPDSGNARFHRLYAGRREVACTADLTDLLEHLESCLHHTVAVGARDALFVHAGVVGWRGRAIVIPGPSHSGKSSLVAELVRAGATYYSDEFAVFDGRGRVHPYRRRLSLRTGGTRIRYAVEEAVGPSGTPALPVGLIAVTAYEPGAQWHPRVLSPAQAVLALFRNTVVARMQPELSLSTLQRVVPGALALESARDEARETVASLLHAVARRSRQGAVPEQGQIAA